MLLEFQCSNFRSIRDTVTLSLRATSDTTREAYIKAYDKYRVLKSAILYGANGSGKSNVLKALAYMQGIIVSNNLVQPGDKIPQETHKKAEENRPSVFKIQFVKNGHRYAYGFSIKDAKIESESLYHFPKGRQEKVFEREGLTLRLGEAYREALENLTPGIRDNRFVLSLAAGVREYLPVREALLFFQEDILMYHPQRTAGDAAALMKDGGILKDRVLKMLNVYDAGIRDIKIEAGLRHDFFREKGAIDVLRVDCVNETQMHYDVQLVYEDFSLYLAEASAGIQKLFGLLCALTETIEKEKVFVCDAFDTDLHEAVAAQIIEGFERAPHAAQLILSAHNTRLLSETLYRRDQIWFTEMKQDRTTDLYSLAEIKHVRPDENFVTGYREGRYGAMPDLKDKGGLS